MTTQSGLPCHSLTEGYEPKHVICFLLLTIVTCQAFGLLSSYATSLNLKANELPRTLTNTTTFLIPQTGTCSNPTVNPNTSKQISPVKENKWLIIGLTQFIRPIALGRPLHHDRGQQLITVGWCLCELQPFITWAMWHHTQMYKCKGSDHYVTACYCWQQQTLEDVCFMPHTMWCTCFSLLLTW